MAAILVGFCVRVYCLGDPNLLNDEWFVLRSAHEGVAWIVALARTFEPHPPLYYLTAAGWISLAGESEFALRFLGATIGMLAIPAAGLIGRLIRHSWFGVVASWLVALNPFLVANAQFARMYAPLSAFALLATVALVLALKASPSSGSEHRETGSEVTRGGTHMTPPRWDRLPRPFTNGVRRDRGGRHLNNFEARGWVRYAVCMLLAMFTHYTAWLTFAAHVVLLAIAIRRRHHPPLVRRAWVLASAALGLIGLAWVVYGLPALVAYRGYFPDPLDPPTAITRLLTVVTAGSFPSATGAALTIAIAVLSLVGTVALVRRDRVVGVPLILVVGIPLAPSLYLMLTRPLFTERYVIGIVPPYLVLAATGAVALDRVLRVPLTALAVLVGTAIALQTYYPGVAHSRPDFRTAARYVDALAQPGDLVVVTRHGTGELFGYYDDLDLEQVVVDRDPRPAIDAIAERDPKNVWLLPAGEDPEQENAVARALLDVAHVADDRWFRGARVLWYMRGARDARSHQVDARWDESLRLLRYTVDEAPREPGEPIAVGLNWSAEQPLHTDYKLSFRFVDERGRVAAQLDRSPLNGLEPTRSWPTGREVIDRHAIAVPPLLPGRYTLDLVAYDPISLRSARLTVGGKEAASVRLARVTVERASRPEAVAALEEHTGSAMTARGLTLESVQLLTPGVTLPEPVRIEIRWRARVGESGLRPDEVRLTLRGRGVGNVADSRQPIADLLMPSAWRPGETFWIRYDLSLPLTTESGTYELAVGIPGPAGEIDTEIVVGDVLVRGPERQYSAPTPTYPVRYRIGEHVELVGYNLSAERVSPGGMVELTLYWHALGTPNRDYTVFTHLLDSATRLRGQHDQPPVGGQRPTTGWRRGEYIVDTYRLRVDDSATGPHDVEVGMYDPTTGVRLPTFDAEGKPIGDRILLARVDVVK